jgi:hypothetical protein
VLSHIQYSTSLDLRPKDWTNFFWMKLWRASMATAYWCAWADGALSTHL